MSPMNEAAWILESMALLEDEISHAVAIQPFDANVRTRAYIDVPYPFISGNGVAGTVHEVGTSVARFKKGDRVKFVVSREATTAMIPTSTTFEDAAAIPFSLLTAVAASHLRLGMNKPGTKCNGKVQVWGASGSLGYEAMATASPRKFEDVRGLGGSAVFDYKDDEIVPKLKSPGPYDFIMTASGDAIGTNTSSEVLQPGGGTFASVGPQSNGTHLAENVHLYGDYLPGALGGNVTPTALEKRPGGLNKIQEACADVLEG
ncbi:hypothetical protein BDV27DRAFT_146023 [Aspergillus caelatus]|uniref:Alcohol dehydrogenase-like N-terminal domain-containing protein n=1 Tax=Aspergillus caelatus TaxID=61420 RepID=A0A5N7A1L7_9EURO|nr:uncharacterized protein BDV27DRAFT_146023 [Aspergillus caelatus]KAE8363585.1 hypothetical protein BDV27DRAFT_146023 [Aspergillus caelatus]